MLKYQNNSVIDYKSLGFSEVEKDNSIKEIEDYFNLIYPKKKITILNEEPDIAMPKKIN